MTIMIGGFCLSMSFMIWYIISAARFLATPGASEEAFLDECRRLGWIGWSGLAMVVVAWLWAGVSSLAIWRDQSSQPPPLPGSARR
jgi:hypothetical protein